MKVKLQDIIDALEWDVDSAVVDDFYKTANTIADSRGFINTDNAEFQLFLRDFLESHELDYQYDLICRYLPKLLDALEIKRDTVLCSDNFDKNFVNPVSNKTGGTPLAKVIVPPSLLNGILLQR